MKYLAIIRVLAYSLLFLPGFLFAQSRKELEKERMEIINRIEATNQALNKNLQSQKATLGDYQLIEKKIRDRERLLSNIQNHLQLADQELSIKNQETSLLTEDLKVLKNKYYYVLNQIYKRNLSQNKWTFILDSESINESFQRWLYIKQYEAYIKELYVDLDKKSELLNQSVKALQLARMDRQKLLDSESEQFDLLRNELASKEQMIEELKEQTETLKSRLNKQKLAREKLNSAIENAIIAAFKGESSSGTVDELSSTDLVSNDEPTINSSKNFNQLKGQLSWPVNNGNIVERYGKHRHPTLQDVFVQNNGIDFDCAVGSEVMSIFGGEVVSVSQVSGFGNIVIIKHGSYYSVYSKLAQTFVNKSDQISTNQPIGQVLQESGRGVLHFEIWNGKEKTNPEKWIKK